MAMLLFVSWDEILRWRAEYSAWHARVTGCVLGIVE